MCKIQTMKKIIFTSIICMGISTSLCAQTTNFGNGIYVTKGNSAGGSAILAGTTYASHFHYAAEEDTYIRGGKPSSSVIIGDVGTAVFLGNAGASTYSQGLLQAQNGLVGVKGNAAGGSAIFVGTTYASHFNFSTPEDTYIRGGKATSNVILSDVGNAVVVGNVPSLPAGYKLFVERGILTEKVKVALRGTANWSDYVFDKKYKLQPLVQVEKFIQKNKHLPGIQSAQQLVDEGGIDVTTMLAKQMEKIEELTLHLIAMDKQLSHLQQENKKQQQEIQSLKNKKQ
jgi:hypothetical protein